MRSKQSTGKPNQTLQRTSEKKLIVVDRRDDKFEDEDEFRKADHWVVSFSRTSKFY